MCGSGNLFMLVIYGMWTKKIGSTNRYLSKDAKTINITVKFQQVPPEHLRKEIFSQMFGSDETDKEKETETKEKEKESDPQPTSKDSTDQ